jgi:hypothetical protein
MIYIIDKLKTLNIPNEALKEGYYTIYKNKFTFQQYIDNKIKRKQTPGSQHLVGRSCNPSQRIYVKEIATKFTKVVT